MILHVIVMGLLVSLDGFFSGISFGIKRVKIPMRMLALISLCPLAVCIAVMVFGQTLETVLTDKAANVFGFLLFFLLFCFTLKDALVKKTNANPSLISLINNPEYSDLDTNNQISSSEALLLGLALAIDNAILCFNFALLGYHWLITPLLFAGINFLLVGLGNRMTALRFFQQYAHHAAFLPSILFFILAFSRLL